MIFLPYEQVLAETKAQLQQERMDLDYGHAERRAEIQQRSQEALFDEDQDHYQNVASAFEWAARELAPYEDNEPRQEGQQ